MKKILTLALLLFTSLCYSQNLVPNPSFELYDTCPNSLGQLRYASYWTNPLYGSTPDFFNACNTTNQIASIPINIRGNEFARTGLGYSFIVTASQMPRNFREYIQAPLSDSLVAGINYCIRFYASAADTFNYVSNNIGVYFSPIEIHDTIYTNPFNLPYVPQFENPSTNNLNSRVGWTEISGTYNAVGGEKYLIIGNFRDSNNTITTYTGWGNQAYAGYYIDDVLVTPCDSLSAIQEFKTEPPIHLFPSISNQLISIEAKERMSAVSIVSIEGIQILNETTDRQHFEIDVSQFQKGIYIVQVKTINKTYNLKFIKN